MIAHSTLPPSGERLGMNSLVYSVRSYGNAVTATVAQNVKLLETSRRRSSSDHSIDAARLLLRSVADSDRSLAPAVSPGDRMDREAAAVIDGIDGHPTVT